MSQGQRRLAAIMFTDIVGYTALSQRDESSALQLLEEHRKTVRPFFAKHNGTEIKTIGDGFLVEFGSALEAVRCGYEIQESLQELNAGKSPDRRAMVRIGIHLGDVVHSQNDVYGDAVNIASRIEPLSDPGGICVTSQVYDQVRNKFEFPLTSLGERTLKNVGEPTEVFKVLLPWLREEGSRQVSGQRIAVLPFTNMSPDPNDEYFADGMTEEVISTMSRIEGIEVISRTSVMQYKKAPKPIRDVSRELEVGTILEGSVRKAGNMLRVTVQMIDAMRDRHLWAESYNRDLEDVFAIQSDIARRVADALEARIPKGVKSGGPAGNIEAYSIYLRATQLYYNDTEQSLQEAVSLFNLAISKDPTFVKAYAGLAHALCLQAGGGYEDFKIVNSAEDAARKALELGPEEAEAHAAMAEVHAYLDRNDQSVEEANRAIRINPNLAQAYSSLAIQYATLGDLDHAREAGQRVYELDPLSPRQTLGWANMMSGRTEEALRIFTRIRELYPNSPGIYSSLSQCYMIKGDFSKAEEVLNEGSQFGRNDPSIVLSWGLLFAFTARRKESEEILQRIMKSEKESVRLYGSLFINCALGNLDEAFKALMRTAETHSWPYLINASPLFRDLRADPRYPEFLKRVGLSSIIGNV